MSDIHSTDLRRLDLTILLVFLGLLRHRKATLVADEIGLTQPAVSHALKRLRGVWGDELFLRRPHGLEPTSVALELEGPVREAVDALRRTLSAVRPFVPEEASGTLRIAAPDVEQAALVPGLIARLAALSPGLRLSILPHTRSDAITALSGSEIDLALGYFPDPGDTVVTEDIFRQSYLVAGKPSVIGPGGRLDISRYCGLPHVLVSPTGDFRGVVDDALQDQGRTRRVVATVPQFFPALATVAEMPCIATLPERLVRDHAHRFGLVFATPPVAVRAFTVSALRHRRDANNPRLAWVTAICREIATQGGEEADGTGRITREERP
jgi:DNA-binding transcriptional LysR family regulator